MYLFDFLSLFPLGLFLEVELLNHMVILFFIFWVTSVLISIVAGPIYSPQIQQHIKRIIYHDQVGFISRVQEWFNIRTLVNAILYVTQEWNCWIIWKLYFQCFERNLQNVFHSSCSSFQPSSSALGFPLFGILATLVIFFFSFDDSHTDRCEVTPHFDIDLLFLWIVETLGTFSCACWLSLWRNGHSGTMLILQSDCAFDIEVYDVFVLWILTPYWKYLLPFSSLPFIFVDGFFAVH